MRLFSYPRNQQWSLDDSAQRADNKNYFRQKWLRTFFFLMTHTLKKKKNKWFTVHISQGMSFTLSQDLKINSFEI